MKNTGLALILLSVIVIASAILFASGHQTNRENELEAALGVAVDNTLENLMIDKNYEIKDADEFIADFLEDFLMQIESSSDVNVVIKGVDTDLGLLSVEVTLSYQYNNGKRGTVSCDRTVIFEQSESSYAGNTILENNKQIHNVSFYTLNEKGEYVLFKAITVAHGTKLSIPKSEPLLFGKTFMGWSTQKSGSPVTSQSVTIKNDMTYYAIFQ